MKCIDSLYKAEASVHELRFVIRFVNEAIKVEGNNPVNPANPLNPWLMLKTTEAVDPKQTHMPCSVVKFFIRGVSLELPYEL
jgi:hypothetical protein